jgi:ABC-2 type transport system ATP-binding protein
MLFQVYENICRKSILNDEKGPKTLHSRAYFAIICTMNAIASESLSKVYRNGIASKPTITAIDSITLEVNRGEIFSLLGPNGAGKTTFIKVLLGLTHPTSGSASILGAQIPNVKVKERIGYLPENHRYPGYLTAEEVLWFFGRLSGVGAPGLASRISPLLGLVGIAQWRNMKAKKYSKGMLQRLGLAQALINDPELIFLDEPTDGVDPVGRKEIRTVLQNLKNEGKTIFLNSHLLSEVELISDRVAILDKGKLLKVGTVDELTSTGSQYQIGIGHPPTEGFKDEASALVMKLSYGVDGITVALNTTAELNALIDLLRKHHIEITSVVKKRSSLEDSFINIITPALPTGSREVAS